MNDAMIQLQECAELKLSWNEKLTYLVYKLYDPNAPDVCPVTHRFDKGTYIRTMFIPKGQLFIGRPHRYGHVVSLVSGKAILIEEAGQQVKEAPAEMTTRPGYMTCAFMLTDVFVNTFHPNPRELRDVQVLEDDIFESLDSLLLRGKELSEQLLLEESV